MKLLLTLLLLIFTQAESKWNSDYDHRQHTFNHIQHKDSDESIEIQNVKKSREYLNVENPQIEQSPQRYNRNNWPHNNKNEHLSLTNERHYKFDQGFSTQKDSHFHDRPTRNENKHTHHWKPKHDWHERREMNEVPTSTSGPPDHKDLVSMARYVIHNADWASIATISTLPAIEGFPFSNVKSMVDGFIANSTGIPYFYMSPLDFSARDLKENSRSTVLATLEETKYCIEKEYDAEDPRCTRVMLSGKMKKLKENSTEFNFAKGALFERHPSMAGFPADHNFFVAKLKIAQIAMVDWFGGAKYIPVRDYLAFNYTQQITEKFNTSNERLVKTP